MPLRQTALLEPVVGLMAAHRTALLHRNRCIMVTAWNAVHTILVDLVEANRRLFIADPSPENLTAWADSKEQLERIGT